MRDFIEAQQPPAGWLADHLFMEAPGKLPRLLDIFGEPIQWFKPISFFLRIPSRGKPWG